MKKLFAVLLVLCLLMPCAFADSLRNLSDEELADLLVDVKEEMIRRKMLNGEELPAGVYYIGMGMKEGTYICTSTYGGGAALIYKSFESFLNGEEYVSRAWITSGHSYQMALYGDVCYVLEFPSVVVSFEDVW